MTIVSFKSTILSKFTSPYVFVSEETVVVMAFVVVVSTEVVTVYRLEQLSDNYFLAVRPL